MTDLSLTPEVLGDFGQHRVARPISPIIAKWSSVKVDAERLSAEATLMMRGKHDCRPQHEENAVEALRSIAGKLGYDLTPRSLPPIVTRIIEGGVE